MNYRKLGSTELMVSEIGFGAWAIGGQKWGKDVNDKDSIETIERACELGVNFFDTADAYGDGHSEELLGQVLRNIRSKVIIASKGGLDFRTPDRRKNFSKEYLIKACEESLTRLGTDYIDLYQLHCPSIEIIEQGEIFETLEMLKQAGKIRYSGLSLWNPEEVIMALNTATIDAYQVNFNIIRQDFLEAIKIVGDKNIGIIVNQPLASGILSGKYNVNTIFDDSDQRKDRWSTDKLKAIESILMQVQSCIKPPFKSMFEVALAFILSFSEVSTVIPGAKRPSQIEMNVSVQSLKLEHSDLQSLLK